MAVERRSLYAIHYFYSSCYLMLLLLYCYYNSKSLVLSLLGRFNCNELLNEPAQTKSFRFMGQLPLLPLDTPLSRRELSNHD